MPSALDNGRHTLRKLLRAVVARLLGRKPKAKREPPGQRLSQRFDWSGPRVRLVVFHLS